MFGSTRFGSSTKYWDQSKLWCRMIGQQVIPVRPSEHSDLEIISDDAERRRLISMKPFFKDDLASGRLGNPASNGLLRVIKP